MEGVVERVEADLPIVYLVQSSLVQSAGVQDDDVQRFISLLDAAYRARGGHTFSRVEKIQGTSVDGTPGAIFNLASAITVSASGGVLSNRTHPLQRKIGVGPSGMLFSGDLAVYLEPSPTGTKADQVRFVRFSNLEIQAWAAAVSPTHLPYEIKLLAQTSPDVQVGRTAEGGWAIRSATAEYTFAGDLTLVRKSTTNRVGNRSEVTVSEHSKSSIMAAGFPRRLVARYFPKGKSEPSSTTEYEMGEPTLTGSLDRSVFEWWTYAGEAKDFTSEAALGPHNIPIIAIPDVPTDVPTDGRSTASSDAMFVDTPKDMATNPPAQLLPRPTDRTNRWLFAVGIFCIVVAAGVFARRRAAG